jgi:uncharacterized Rmd1/YagE family protein
MTAVTLPPDDLGELLPAGRTGPVVVRALRVGERITADALDLLDVLGDEPEIGRLASGCAVVMPYGAVVLFGLTSYEEGAFLERLAPFVVEPLDEVEEEEVTLQVGGDVERIRHGVIEVPAASIPVLQVVGEVLARSVSLNHHEELVRRELEAVEPWARGLAEGRRAPPEPRLLERIGRMMLIGNDMVGRVEVQESPELIWEHEELERFFLQLRNHYDLLERDAALDRKLEQLGRTVQTLVELHQDRRSVRLEVYIVVLIVVEVILTVYDLFVRG